MSEILNTSSEERIKQDDWSDLGEEVPYQGELMTSEEKEKNLTFENMAKLSSEEYIQLWRKLNPFYVTHITRQGVRDHVGMIYHSGGAGEFVNGIKDILENEKALKSPAEVRYGLPPNFTEEDVRKVLDEMVFNSDEYQGYSPREILTVLPFNCTMASADAWADGQAVHFGQQTVLNELYGGETDNEAFFVFPTDVIASQSKFGGHMHDNLTTAQVFSERKWNDMFVWPEGGKITVDAGFVFLPSSQMVDRNTGSKYATKEIVDESGNVKLVAEKDEGRIKRFEEWVKGLSDESVEIVMARDRDYTEMKKVFHDIGIPEECFSDMVEGGAFWEIVQCSKVGHFNYLFGLSEEEKERMSEEEIFDYSVRQYLSRHLADLKLAEDVVNAEEYWEQYFADHPEQMPAHIVYYDGEPSVAVKKFLIDNGILVDESQDLFGRPIRDDDAKIMTGPGDTSERDGEMLGFEEHFIGDGDKDEALVSENRRFNEIALKILEERYGGQEQQRRRRRLNLGF